MMEMTAPAMRYLRFTAQGKHWLSRVHAQMLVLSTQSFKARTASVSLFESLGAVASRPKRGASQGLGPPEAPRSCLTVPQG